MTHLGRFVLIEFNGYTSEGYALVPSESHVMEGKFPIYDVMSSIVLGDAVVMQMGQKYYMDIYENKGLLSPLMDSGRKKFSTMGTIIKSERSRVYTYHLSGIFLLEEKSSNHQVFKYPTLIKPDLNSSAFCTGKYL